MIGDKIKELRKIEEITQQDLASQLGISFQALSNYENNRREPNIDTIKKLCIIFDCSIDELLDFDTDAKRNELKKKLLKK